MAVIQEVNIPDHEDNDPFSVGEKKIAPRQSLETKVVASEEKKTTKVQVRESEWWPTPPKKNLSDEVKIQKLEDLAVSQQEEMGKLRKQLEEVLEALTREREASFELHFQAQKQKQTITDHQIEVRHFRSETKKHKKGKEAVLFQLSKSEEDKLELKATLSSSKKEGCKINRNLKEERRQTEMQTRKLGDVQNEIGRLHKEIAQLHSTVNNLESQVISLNFENTDLEDENVKQQFEIKLKGRIIKKMTSDLCSMAAGYEEQKLALESQISDYKLSVNDCKLSLEKAETKLKSTKKDNKMIAKRLRAYKARNNRRGKILKSDNETKVEMKEKIETLQKENERLRSELNNGFIGCYRQMKRFFCVLQKYYSSEPLIN